MAAAQVSPFPLATAQELGASMLSLPEACMLAVGAFGSTPKSPMNFHKPRCDSRRKCGGSTLLVISALGSSFSRRRLKGPRAAAGEMVAEELVLQQEESSPPAKKKRSSKAALKQVEAPEVSDDTRKKVAASKRRTKQTKPSEDDNAESKTPAPKAPARKKKDQNPETEVSSATTPQQKKKKASAAVKVVEKPQNSAEVLEKPQNSAATVETKAVTEVKPLKTPRKKAPPKPKLKLSLEATTTSSMNGSAKKTPGKTVVVVESAAKVKTIEKYLGRNYQVVPSYGHVRNLATRSGSVRPQDDFSLIWEVGESQKNYLNQIINAVKDAQAIILACDPDREGEAIAWHVLEMLKVEGALKPRMKVQRVTFNEITKSAVLAGIGQPREISQSLVDAYLARRALDYLIGFDISPLIWRKLPGSKSAGRVQSAALCLLCEREKEIETFVSREYWTVEAEVSTGRGAEKFPAKLVSYKGVKLEQFTLTAGEAEAAVEQVSKSSLRVRNLKSSKAHRQAPPPYTTSTLQEDASNKLNMSVARTMLVAQKLYEGVDVPLEDDLVGLITYMRTDSLVLSQQATSSIRAFAEERYGKEYVPESARVFSSNIKNAQESHEAIRPTDIRRLPSSLVDVLDADGLRLYAMIWRRTMACQLTSAAYSQSSLEIGDSEGNVLLRSTASTLQFPGYQIVYNRDSGAGDGEQADTKLLPRLEVGHEVSAENVRTKQHFTEPPPRYTEGSLVKKMEEIGIGRPSTYAPTVKTLQLRRYVRMEKQRIFAELRGRMVAAFLTRYFPEFVDYGFTSKMEEQLDAVSNGATEWKEVMRQFWPSFHSKIISAGQVSCKEVVAMLAELFSDKFTGMNRTCPDCRLGELVLKLTKYGAGYFLGCNRYPSCHYCNNLDSEDEGEENSVTVYKSRNVILGVEPELGLVVEYRQGPYGDYIQIGEDGKLRPQRIRLPTCFKKEEVDLKLALELMRYPKDLGEDAEGKSVTVGIGKAGFYIRRGGYSVNVPPETRVQELTLESGLELFEKGKAARRDVRKPRTTRTEFAVSESSHLDEEDYE